MDSWCSYFFLEAIGESKPGYSIHVTLLLFPPRAKVFSFHFNSFVICLTREAFSVLVIFQEYWYIVEIQPRLEILEVCFDRAWKITKQQICDSQGLIYNPESFTIEASAVAHRWSCHDL